MNLPMNLHPLHSAMADLKTSISAACKKTTTTMPIDRIRAQAAEMLAAVPGGATLGRTAMLVGLLETHHHRGVVLQVCGDERTGVRFGQAKCRQSPDGERCALKIGYSTYRYQLWATWTPSS